MCQQRHRVWFTSQDQDGRRSRSGPRIAEESGMYTLRLTCLAGALGSALLGAHPCAYRTQDVRYSKVFSSTPFVDTAQPVYAGGGKSVVYEHAADPKPSHVEIRPEDLVAYELHVQDYTARIAGLAPEARGTYLGL